MFDHQTFRMTRTALSFAFLLLTSILYCQDFDSEDFLNRHHEINRNGMLVLGSWAIGNIAVSGIGLGNSNGQAKAFHQMNIGWGVVNLAIAGFGYYGSLNPETGLSLAETIQEHESMKRILLFNAGLDVAYVTAGFYLRERSKNEDNAARFRGFGNSIIMQGGFLLLFDAVMYYVHSNHGDHQLYDMISGLQLTPNSVGYTYRF